jgi:hypothetical protein
LQVLFSGKKDKNDENPENNRKKGRIPGKTGVHSLDIFQNKV